jgi:hypothetical protein
MIEYLVSKFIDQPDTLSCTTVLAPQKQRLHTASQNTFGAPTNIPRQESAYFQCKLQFSCFGGWWLCNVSNLDWIFKI